MLPPRHLSPTEFRSFVRRSTTWQPDEAGIPAEVIGEARRLAADVAQTPGRQEAVARHLAALGACRVGWITCVGRAALFQAPGLLLADPRREALYWSLDPGVPTTFENACIERLRPLFGWPEECEASRDTETANPG